MSVVQLNLEHNLDIYKYISSFGRCQDLDCAELVALLLDHDLGPFCM